MPTTLRHGLHITASLPAPLLVGGGWHVHSWCELQNSKTFRTAILVTVVVKFLTPVDFVFERPSKWGITVGGGVIYLKLLSCIPHFSFPLLRKVFSSFSIVHNIWKQWTAESDFAYLLWFINKNICPINKCKTPTIPFWKVLTLGYWIESYQYGQVNIKTFPIIINHIEASVEICLQWVVDTLKCLKHQVTRVSFSVLPLRFIVWIMHLCQTHDHPFQTLASLTYFSPSTRSTLSLFHFHLPPQPPLPFIKAEWCNQLCPSWHAESGVIEYHCISHSRNKVRTAPSISALFTPSHLTTLSQPSSQQSN